MHVYNNWCLTSCSWTKMFIGAAYIMEKAFKRVGETAEGSNEQLVVNLRIRNTKFFNVWSSSSSFLNDLSAIDIYTYIFSSFPPSFPPPSFPSSSFPFFFFSYNRTFFIKVQVLSLKQIISMNTNNNFSFCSLSLNQVIHLVLITAFQRCKCWRVACISGTEISVWMMNCMLQFNVFLEVVSLFLGETNK